LTLVQFLMLLSVSQLSHSGKMSQTSKFFLGETLIMVVTSALLVVVNCQSEVPPISSNVTSVFTLESVRKQITYVCINLRYEDALWLYEFSV